jgi:branched-chain amino acid transport system substrate-binding protein
MDARPHCHQEEIHMSRRFVRYLHAILALALLGTLLLTGCQPAQPTQAPPPAQPTQAAQAPAATAAPKQGSTYKIGFLASVTGGASTLGEPERNSAMLLQKQIDAQGGIVGPDGVRHPVKILIHDTETNSDTAITLAKKLINDEQVIALIGPTTSPEAMAMIPVVQEAEITLLSMASSSAIVKPVAERKWVFKVAQSNEHTAPWQARYAKSLGATKIANLYVNNAYGEDGAVAIRDTAKDLGLEIVLEETFDAADTDMTAQLSKIKASGAEAVLVTAIPPAAAIFTKQYRELGLPQPLIHNHGVAMTSFIALAGAENLEGVVFPMSKLVAANDLPDSDPQKAVLQGHIKAFMDNTGKAPGSFEGHAWDCIMLALNALEQLPEGLALAEQRVQFRDNIENTKSYVGVNGVFNLSATDHVGLSTKDVVLVRITGGEWTYLPFED